MSLLMAGLTAGILLKFCYLKRKWLKVGLMLDVGVGSVIIVGIGISVGVGVGVVIGGIFL